MHGHRGSRGTHPENSLRAFQEAVQAGADFIELDTQISKDGVPIVWHDAFFSKKLCPEVTSPVLIVSLWSSEIAKIACGPDHDPILSLEQFFSWFRSVPASVRCNLEIKVPPRGEREGQRLAWQVIRIIEKFYMQERVILQSFSFPILEWVSQRAPSIKRSYLTDRRDFCKIAEEWPGVELISPDFHSVTAESVRLCKKLGVAILPYTVNLPRDWKRMREVQVSGIITDYPRKLREFLGGR